MIKNKKIQFLIIAFTCSLISCNTVSEPIFGGTITDVEGNIYNTVTIGSQTWMMENLKTTHYRDSTLIPILKDSAAWANTTSDAYCWYKNDSIAYKENFGALYNWYTVNTGKLAPKGWHVASADEWLLLENNISTYINKSKSIAKTIASKVLWARALNSGTVGYEPNLNNYSGFNALPGGYRLNNIHSFSKMDSIGAWWTSSQSDTIRFSWSISIANDQSTIDRRAQQKWYGFSVRCIKD